MDLSRTLDPMLRLVGIDFHPADGVDSFPRFGRSRTCHGFLATGPAAPLYDPTRTKD
jgi:hypothetical protein